MESMKSHILGRLWPSRQERSTFASFSISSSASQNRSVSLFFELVRSAAMHPVLSAKYRSRSLGTIALNFFQSDSAGVFIGERLRSDTTGRSPVVVCADWIGVTSGFEY